METWQGAGVVGGRGETGATARRGCASGARTLGMRSSLCSRYSHSFLIPRSTAGPGAFSTRGALSAFNTLGTRELYRLTGTRAAVAMPKQLHGRFMETSRNPPPLAHSPVL